MANNPVFHSKDIADTKAKEKREVFVKVEEKKTLKQSAEEFQKKFAEAKAHAAETRAKIENPGADENGVIRSGKRFVFPTKLLLKITVPLLLLGAVGFVIYQNWDNIYHEFFEVSQSRAIEFLAENPDKFISMYDTLIEQAEDEDEKVELLLNRIALLSEIHGDKYSEQIKSDAYKAYEILPCYETALEIINVEEKYGSPTAATEWTEKLDTLEKEGLVLGNG